MANVQFGGLITGLDTNALISGLVKAERRSIDVLWSQKVRFQAQDGILTSLIGALGNLKSSAQSLSLPADFNKRSASTSDSTVFTVSADSTAQTGSYNVVVDTLAKAKSIRSASFSTGTDAIGTGTLTVTVGTTNTSVTIDSTNNTLSGLKDAFNSSGAAVTASIVNVGTGGSADYRLVVQSKKTGIENAVVIAGTLAAGADPFPAGGELVQAAADAVFSVNGLAVTRSGNSVSDVIPGVNLNLVKQGDGDGLVESTDASAIVTVASDTTAIKSSIKSFAERYNAVVKIVNDQFTLNPDTKRQGSLGGDASLRGVLNRLRSELSAAGGIGVGFKFISDVGISFQKDGSLTVDEAKLTGALESDPTGVSNLFTLLQGGIGKRVPDAVDDFVSSVDGFLTFRQSGIRASIDRIDKKAAREEVRIATFEERLLKQFSALEQMVSQLKSQGDFLTQRLNALNSK